MRFQCVCRSSARLDFFLSSDDSICSAVAFPLLENSNHVVVSVSIDFCSNSKRKASFHWTAFEYSYADLGSLWDYFKDIPWDDVFQIGTSAAAAEF